MTEIQNSTGIEDVLSDIRQIIEESRNVVFKSISQAQLDHNWRIGCRIVEDEQAGASRAQYGSKTIEEISKRLCVEYGDGYSERNLRDFRCFYLVFKDEKIWHTRVPNLKWSHLRLIMRIDDSAAREWYINEASNENWSVRTLDRNISTQYYQRLLLSQSDKAPVIAEMKEKTASFQRDKLEFIKNPSVLEFIGLPNNKGFLESDLEEAILKNLQDFLLELGKGFSFVRNQWSIRTAFRDYSIDLVFYNYIIKCFFLIDLKMDRVTHQDVGQMDMYVRMFDEIVKQPDDNPTIGIVLCSQTDPDIARYSILKGNEQLFATKYQLKLPTPQELNEEVARQKEILRLQFMSESNNSKE